MEDKDSKVLYYIDKLTKEQKFGDAYAKYIDTMESIRNKFDM